MQTEINNTLLTIITQHQISFKMAMLKTCNLLQVIPSKENITNAKNLFYEVETMRSSGISF